MARVIDVRNSGGQLEILGAALVLPSDNSSTSALGSLRFNPVEKAVEVFDGNAWNPLISNKLAVSLLGASNGIATLDEAGKLPSSQLTSAIAGGLVFEGTWNAATNAPPLASGTGVKGTFYTVSANGSTELDGISDWTAGDLAIFDGITWDKIDGLSSNAAAIAGSAPLHSPIFTGDPQVPLPLLDDSSDSIASTRFVKAQNYISGNQTITLTGAVSGSGSTAIVTSLAPVPPGSFLGNAGTAMAEPVATTLSDLLDSLLGAAPGSTLCRGETGWELLPLGAPGSVLKSNGTQVQWDEAVVSVNGRTGAVTLVANDVIQSLGYTPAKTINEVAADSSGNVNLPIVSGFNGRNGAVELTAADIIAALGYTPLQDSAKGLSVSFGGSILNSPFGGGQILTRIAMGFPVTLPRGLPDSTAVCMSIATTPVTLSILKNGVAIGFILFAAGSTTGTFNFISDVAFVVGDILELDAPNPSDATFGNLTFTIVGYR